MLLPSLKQEISTLTKVTCSSCPYESSGVILDEEQDKLKNFYGTMF